MARHCKLVLGMVALAGALMLGACGRAVEASGNITDGPAPDGAVKVVAADNDFVPDTIKAKAGEVVTVEVANRGDSDHNFVIAEMDVSTGTLKPGETATATFQMPESSTEFVCTFHGGMEGELVPEGA